MLFSQASNASSVTDVRVPDANNAINASGTLTGVGVSGIVKNAGEMQAPDKEQIGDAVEELTGVDAPTSVEELNAKNALAVGKNLTNIQAPDAETVLKTAGGLTGMDIEQNIDDISNIQAPGKNQIINAIGEGVGVEAANEDDVYVLVKKVLSWGGMKQLILEWGSEALRRQSKVT